ncbi:RpiB/LacA/LacB family sugar-phosphate isomerase [Patescibacteria group bacterium]|nr:RpiB/LacA/LacB family sugar-phosphate isomerase [Patescibacteria group bacterium]MBU1755070.1 RpiB/LacA/LacB family sugar-phosphate isomerase [Patescibacteria group bacterium]
MQKVFIAADHAGFALKESLKPYLIAGGYSVEDIGASEFESTDDYPDYIVPCARHVADTEGAFGIVIGSSGHGEAMAANRVPGIRASVFYGPATAAVYEAEGTGGKDGCDIVRVARQHNNANVLSLGARFITPEQAREAVLAFLTTPFSEGERHLRRIAKF